MKPKEHSPKIIILIGLSGSGKTVWTENFLKTHDNYVVVSSDDIIQKKADSLGKTYSEIFDTSIEAAEQEFKNNLRNSIEKRENIIVDRTNITKKARRRVLSIVPKEYEKIAVTFSVNDAELKTRLLQREFKTGKHIPDFVISDMRTRYQEPDSSEGFSEIIHVAF